MTQQYVTSEGQFLVANVDTAASGDVALIAGVTGKIIKVWYYDLQTAAAGNYIFKDGSTAFTGLLTFAGNATMSFAAPGGRIPLPMSVAANFTINKSNTAQLSGFVIYTIDAVGDE